MRAGRLRLTLYLGGFVLAFVAAGLIVGFLAIRPPRQAEPRAVLKHIVADLARLRGDPPRLTAELAELTSAGIEVTLYDRQHREIASNALSEIPRDADSAWTFHFRLVPADEDIEGVVRVPAIVPGSILVPLAILLAALVALVFVIARHLGGPLQRIESAARRFGEGDLEARAGVSRNDELGEVGRAFDTMADRVTELMSAQRELMVNVSHELHTPLARIQVAIDLLVDGIEHRTTELLPQVARDLEELQRLIDDVMAVSRFELASTRHRGVVAPIARAPTPMREVIDDALQRFRARQPGRSVELRVADELPLVPLDRVLVRRVIDNLLGNAAKYSEPGAPIVVTADTTSAGLTISVADQGIGIDVADLPHVFTPFFRADRSRTRSTGGFGLGLAFARRVVEAHQGTIRIASTPGEGTTVAFTLPVSLRATHDEIIAAR